MKRKHRKVECLKDFCHYGIRAGMHRVYRYLANPT